MIEIKLVKMKWQDNSCQFLTGTYVFEFIFKIDHVGETEENSKFDSAGMEKHHDWTCHISLLDFSWSYFCNKTQLAPW